MRSERPARDESAEPAYMVGLRILARAIAEQLARAEGIALRQDGSLTPTGDQRAQTESPPERSVLSRVEPPQPRQARNRRQKR